MSRRSDAEIRRRHRAETYTFAPFRWRVEIPESPLEGPGRPKGRSGHRLVYHEGCFYSFGGYNPEIKISDSDLIDDPHWKVSRPLFKELWRYNVHSKKWTKLPVTGNAPDQLASHSVAMFGSKMLVYGGTGMPFGLTTSSDVKVMDLKSGNWETLETEAEGGMPVNMPGALYGQAVVVHKGNFYTVGGTSGNEYFMDVHRLNLATKQWKRLHRNTGNNIDEPEARYRHELCVYNDRIFMFGGGTSFMSQGFETLHAFNLETNTWERVETKGHRSRLKPMEALGAAGGDGGVDEHPEPRRCHSLISDGRYAYLIGGFDGDDIFRHVWRLDLETLTWMKVPHEMPKAVYFSSACITESGKAYTFGGVSEVEGNRRTRKVYSAWTRIPSLRHMAWEALNHYSPGLDLKPSGVMLGEGIPGDLIDQLKEGLHAPG